jgi:hypothetical protein
VQKPDFSGEWTLNLEASALSPVVAPVVQSGFVRIEHLEPSVSVHLSITMDGKPFDVRFTRPSNWDGDALVFIDRVQTPNSEMTELRGAGREQDNVWVFDRALAP